MHTERLDAVTPKHDLKCRPGIVTHEVWKSSCDGIVEGNASGEFAALTSTQWEGGGPELEIVSSEVRCHTATTSSPRSPEPRPQASSFLIPRNSASYSMTGGGSHCPKTYVVSSSVCTSYVVSIRNRYPTSLGSLFAPSNTS